MKRYVFIIVCFAIFLLSLPVNAQEFYIEGSADEVWESIELHADFFDTFINKKNCIKDNFGKEDFVYSCEVNASTRVDVITDKYLNAYSLMLMAKTKSNDELFDHTYDWVFLLVAEASHDAYYDDIMDVCIQALRDGEYEDNLIEIVAGPHDGSFVLIIRNKY